MQTQQYFPDADVLKIRFNRKDVVDTIHVCEGMYVKIDKQGRPVQIDIMDARNLVRIQDNRPVVLVKDPPTMRQMHRLWHWITGR